MFQSTFALSGAECATALERLGLTLLRRQDGLFVLRRGAQLILIPEATALSAPVLDRVLQHAHVTLGALLQALDDIPTEADRTCLAPRA